MIQALFGTLVRHGLSFLGAWLVSKGLIDAEAASSLTETLTGVALTVLALALSYMGRTKNK